MPLSATITAAEVRSWFGRDAPALSAAACERLAGLMQRLATPRHLLQPTPAYAAYVADWSERLDPIPNEMLWDAKAVLNAVRLLRDIVPKLRKWDDLLGTPDTRVALDAMERVDRALADALPHLECAWGRCLPDHRKSPKRWHTLAVVIAGAFEAELRRAGRKTGIGERAVFWKAVTKALSRVGHEVPTATVFQHVDRFRKRHRTGKPRRTER